MEPGHVAFPAGDKLVGEQDVDGEPVAIRQDGNRVFLRFHGLADAAIDMTAGTAAINLSANTPAGMEHVLACGRVLAVRLFLAGPSSTRAQ